MALQSVNATADSFNPSALLNLYELDTRYVSPVGTVFRFHAGVNGLYQPVVFNSLEYTPFPIEVTDGAIDGKGNPPRPKLALSNVQGFISNILLQQGDIVGARFVTKRVFARYIDNSNFANGGNPFGTPDPTAAYEDEVYFINRKIREDAQVVQFEMCSPFELDGIQIPSRPMLATICTFVYRDPETCGYSGAPLTDRFGKSFTDAVVDGGYGFTLSDKGIWSDAVTYQIGDYVTIISQGDFTYGNILVYVCSAANTTGATNNPQFNQTSWVADACLHNIAGCKTHYPTGPLPGGFFAGNSRASYTD